MAVPDFTMNNGLTMPGIGLGLWQVKDEQECKQAVAWGLEAGYRHFDSAQAYGNEQYLGAAIKESGIVREELFITTKIHVGNFLRARKSFEASLEKLQMEYVDLLLLHFPVSVARGKAWKDLEAIHKEGTAKSIGVSNYTIRHLEELLKKCEVKPAVNQVELHVFLQQPELVDYCKQHDILVEAYSPLAHAQGMDSPVLMDVARKHGKSTAQIMLRWCIQIGAVPLPKSVHKERIFSNFDIFDFSLDKEDMMQLKSLDQDIRTAWDPTHIP